MMTWILAGILIAAMYFASKYVLKSTKEGGCISCRGGGCCSQCKLERKAEAKR